MGGAQGRKWVHGRRFILPGPEMVGDSNVRKDIIKTSYIWFNLPLLGTQTHYGSQNTSLGQNYPNPARNETTILLNGINHPMTLELLNMTGNVTAAYRVSTGMTGLTISTGDLPAGLYLYRLNDNGNTLTTKRMQVIH